MEPLEAYELSGRGLPDGTLLMKIGSLELTTLRASATRKARRYTLGGRPCDSISVTALLPSHYANRSYYPNSLLDQSGMSTAPHALLTAGVLRGRGFRLLSTFRDIHVEVVMPAGLGQLDDLHDILAQARRDPRG